MSNRMNRAQRATNSRGQPTNAALAGRAVGRAAVTASAPHAAATTQVSSDARAALTDAFGPLSDRTIRAMAGALPSAQVEVIAGVTGIGAQRTTTILWVVNGPPLPRGERSEETGDRQYQQRRHIVLQANGEVGPMHNDSFEVAPQLQGQGLASASLAAQVQTLTRLGVTRLDTYAVRSGDPVSGFHQNGFYTWPRLGYNAPLHHGDLADALHETPTGHATAQNHLGDTPANRRAYLSHSTQRFAITPLASSTKARLEALVQMGKPPTIQDLIRTPDGLEWWKYHGSSESMVFNLQHGSPARRRLAANIARRRAAGRPMLNPALIR